MERDRGGAMEALAVGRRNLVAHGAGDQAMDEPPSVGRAQSGGDERSVDGDQALGGDARDLGEAMRLGAVAGDRQRTGDATLVAGELSQAVAQRDAPAAGQRGGAPDRILHDVRAVVRDLVRQLGDQPRVAGGLAVAAVAQRGRGAGHVGAHERGAPLRAERAWLEHGDVLDAAELSEHVERVGRLVRARGEDDEQRDVADATGQIGERLERGAVGPVGVVDQEGHRALLRQRGAEPEQAVRDRRRPIGGG